jgi:hypothetical protein
LEYVRVRESVIPEKGQYSFATNFIVPGRDAVLLHCEFDGSWDGGVSPGLHVFDLYALFDHEKGWKRVGDIPIFVDQAHLQQIRESYVTYDNMRALHEDTSVIGRKSNKRSIERSV